jgi:hypothetical protein
MPATRGESQAQALGQLLHRGVEIRDGDDEVIDPAQHVVDGRPRPAKRCCGRW